MRSFRDGDGNSTFSEECSENGGIHIPGRRPTMHDVLTIAEATEKFCTYGRRRIDIPLAGDERARTRIYGFSVRDGSYLRDGLGQNGISPFFHKYLEIGGSDAYQIF